MAVWRNYVVLFGGFYQTMTRDAWYGDTWVYDTRVGSPGWSECVFPVTSSTPAARSGMQLVAVPNSDTLVMHGGYSEVRVGADRDSALPVPGTGPGAKKGGKPVAASVASFLLKKTRSVVHTDTWVLRLANLASGGQPTWERVRTTGVPPSPRVGFTMVPFKDKLLLFGGVQVSTGAGSLPLYGAASCIGRQLTQSALPHPFFYHCRTKTRMPSARC